MSDFPHHFLQFPCGCLLLCQFWGPIFKVAEGLLDALQRIACVTWLDSGVHYSFRDHLGEVGKNGPRQIPRTLRTV